MANYKIPNVDEVVRWIKDGLTYVEIQDRIEEKYGIRIGYTTISDVRKRYSLPRRLARGDTLVPWSVKPEHTHLHPAQMLRALARRRQGLPNPEETNRKLDSWLRDRYEDNTVAHYDPDLPEGWAYVERRPGIDTDVIREPNRSTRKRKTRG